MRVETQSRSEEFADVHAWCYRAAALCGLDLDNKSQGVLLASYIDIC